MENLINILDVIIWPLTLVILVFFLREEIRKLLKRINSFQYKDFKATFENELNRIEKEANATIKKSKIKKSINNEPIYPEPYDEKYYQLLRIADESPRAALLEGWVEVENAFYEAAKKFKVKSYSSKNIRKILAELIETGHYAKTIYPLVLDIYELRNQAAHTPVFIPTKQQLRRYLEMTIEMALTFRNPLNTEKKITTTNKPQ